MPTYVYKFVETGETIEVQQAFTDDALTEAVHPERGQTMAVKKVFQPVGVTFKGAGFYKTDSRSSTSGSKSSAATGSPSTSSESGSSSAGGESSGSTATSTTTTTPSAPSSGSSTSSGSGD